MMYGALEKKIIKKLNFRKNRGQDELFLSIIEYIFNIYFKGVYIDKDCFYLDEVKFKRNRKISLKKLNIGSLKKDLVSDLRRFKNLIEDLEKQKYIFFKDSSYVFEKLTSNCKINDKEELENKIKVIDKDLHDFFFKKLTNFYYDDYLKVLREDHYIVTESDRYKSEKNFQVILTLGSIVFTAISTFLISSMVPVTITYKESNVFPHLNLESSKINYVTINILKVRVLPDSNSDAIGVLTYGETVRKIETKTKTKWSKIFYSKGDKVFSGWVSSKYLEEI